MLQVVASLTIVILMTRGVTYAPRGVTYAPRGVTYAPGVISYAPRKHLPYFIEYSAHFYTLKMMLKYSLRTIRGR